MMQASDALTNNPVMGGKKLIRPSRGWVAINFTAVWQRRGLLYFLTWRDIKVRYKQTFLGIAWVVLQPFLMMVVFSIFFGMLVKVPSDGIPYPVFTFCALAPWQLVANAFTDAGNSLTVNQNLLTKVYFPRIIIPLAAVFARLIDFGCAVLILIGLMFYYHITPRAAILTLPVFVLFAICIGVGAGLWVAALSIKYRDVRHMIPFITQLWFFLSPIAYPASVVPTDWRFLYAINPMVGVIEGFRWALLGKGEVPGVTLIVSFVVAVLLFGGGVCYFRQKEGTIADVL
jgi:lipopolysaccharide transport system permease protein